MESKDKLKEIDIKNLTCYYFDDIIRFWDRYIDFNDILLNKTLHKEKYQNILNMTFHTKLKQVQKHCALGSTK